MHAALTLSDGNKAICQDGVRVLVNKVLKDDGRSVHYFQGKRINEEAFAALVGSGGRDSRAGGYSGLPDLPSNVDPFWSIYYLGDFGGPGERPGSRTIGDEVVAKHAYHGITRAYSDLANGSASCGFPSDTRSAITTTYFRDANDPSTGVEDPNALILYHPSDHGPVVRRTFVGERNPMLRGWIRDGRNIMDALGCRGDGVLILRENIRRFIEGKNPLTGSEAQALIDRS